MLAVLGVASGMKIPLSEKPGRHERHYRRRLNNPLFGDRAVTRDDDALLENQRLDHEELITFLQTLRQAVQRAVALKPNEGSEVILELKEQFDRLYEQSAGLADEQAGNQSALADLLDVVMRNVERGAGADPQAADELAQERAARSTHFELLRFPLVADLLHPDTTIEQQDLAPTLLSENEPALAAALALFDAEQLSAVYASAEQCVAQCAEPPTSAAARLRQIGDRLVALNQRARLN